MSKPIPGTNKLKIDLAGKITPSTEYCNDYTLNGDIVTLAMYGCPMIVSRKWLSLVAHFEINIPFWIEDGICRVSFVELTGKIKEGCATAFPYFTKPIYVEEGYRLVPGYTHLAVNKDGNVREISDWKEPTITLTDGYNTIWTWWPDRSNYQQTAIHKLVALAWLHNDDPQLKRMVNHKNGNKLKNSYLNLEWCTALRNNEHAIETGLRTDCVPCHVRNVITKEVTEYPSVAKACVAMGLRADTPKPCVFYKNLARLVAGKFEVRLVRDPTPWYYENKEKLIKPMRFEFNVVHPNGKENTYYGTKYFQKFLKLWNVGMSADKLMAAAEKQYPGIKITVTDHYKHDRKTPKRENLSKASEIDATNSETNIKLHFNSLTKAAKYFAVDRSVIQRCAKMKDKLGSWIIQFSDNE